MVGHVGFFGGVDSRLNLVLALQKAQVWLGRSDPG